MAPVERRGQPPRRFAADPSQLVQPPGCVLTWTVHEALAQLPRGALAGLQGLTPLWRVPGSVLHRIDADGSGKAEPLR